MWLLYKIAAGGNVGM